MTFLYPLGLWGLAVIPLLILIYILKNKHTEQVVSSTYLWRLSERFLKRRNPISRITGIISLVLQILAVTFISLAIAHPVLTLRNAADDYVFILDASGSMHYEKAGKTRFDLGKEEIEKIIARSANGSTYTLISAGEVTGTLFEGITDRTQATSLLAEAELSAAAVGFADARGLAQEIFAKNPASKIYLVTDKSYESLQNVELINDFAVREENYAVSDLKQGMEDGKLIVTGKAISYESDAQLRLRLKIAREGDALYNEQTLSVSKLEETEFRFEVENTPYSSITVQVGNVDALPLDNESILYSVSSSSERKDVLVVSEDPFFVQTAISTQGGKTVETVAPGEYLADTTGYQLYVFEGYSPETLPTDGAVWFINPTKSVEKSGFNVQGDVELTEPGLLEFSTSTATRIRELLKDTLGSQIYIKKYVKCNFNRSFYTLLSYRGSPVVFAGTNSYDNREVVFAYDFHASDSAILPDHIVLFRNLLEFTFPTIVSETSYYCGSAVPINVLANCDSIRIDTPGGGIAYLDTGSDMVEYTLTEVGTYKITQMIEGNPQSVYVYGNLPKEERASLVSDGAFTVDGEPSSDRRDGKYDDLTILLILLAAIFLADWVVYCYEQYKLR